MQWHGLMSSLSNELPSLGIDQSQDDVEQGNYDEDDDSDYDLDDAMRHFGLMANLRGYMLGGKEWVLDSGCTDHMTGDKDMFRELAENDGPRKYVTFGENSRGKVVGLGKVAISHDSSIQMLCLLNLLATTYFQYLDLLISVSMSYLLK